MAGYYTHANAKAFKTKKKKGILEGDSRSCIRERQMKYEAGKNKQKYINLSWKKVIRNSVGTIEGTELIICTHHK